MRIEVLLLRAATRVNLEAGEREANGRQRHVESNPAPIGRNARCIENGGSGSRRSRNRHCDGARHGIRGENTLGRDGDACLLPTARNANEAVGLARVANVSSIGSRRGATGRRIWHWSERVVMRANHRLVAGAARWGTRLNTVSRSTTLLSGVGAARGASQTY
jgi:hypothetical protein